MPKLKDAQNSDLSGYEPVMLSPTGSLPPMTEFQPKYNPYIRCPLPPISVTPDSLRQYYVGGQVPQFRVLTPTNNTSSGGTNTTNITQNIISSTTSGGGTSSSLTAKSISISTAVLNPFGIFFGSLGLSKSFQLISVAASSPCRIEIYGSLSAQTLDAGRAIDSAPIPGTQQDLITDLILDTIPYQWSWQNRIGANTEVPQNPAAYITVTNIDTISEAITVSLVYVPIES